MHVQSFLFFSFFYFDVITQVEKPQLVSLIFPYKYESSEMSQLGISTQLGVKD